AAGAHGPPRGTPWPSRRGRACARSGNGRRRSRASPFASVVSALALAVPLALALVLLVRRRRAGDPAGEVVGGPEQRLLESGRHAARVDRRDHRRLQPVRGCERAAAVVALEESSDFVAASCEARSERCRKTGGRRSGGPVGATA